MNYNELTWQERKKVRLDCINEQKGLCHHCKNPLNGMPSEDIMRKRINTKLFPSNFFKWPIHLHHDHKTGKIIGAVHCHCNAYLWQYLGE